MVGTPRLKGQKPSADLNRLPKLSVFGLKYGKSRRETSENRPRGKIGGLGLQPHTGKTNQPGVDAAVAAATAAPARSRRFAAVRRHMVQQYFGRFPRDC